MLTRAEHIQWCKQNARKYLDVNDAVQAVMSMISDLAKHPETVDLAAHMGILGLFATGSVAEARKFIEGFAE